MADDDLSVPLGRNAKPKPRRFKLPIRASHVIAGGLGAFVCSFAVWAVMVDDPFGGEPTAIVATGFDDAKPPMPKVVVANGTQGPRSYDGPGGIAPKQIQIADAPTAASALPPNAKTVTIIDGSTGKRQEVLISAGAGVSTPQAPAEQRLLETSRHGPIPKVGPDGSRPADVYARPLPPGRKSGPQIAIVVANLGVSAIVTQRAMDKLPSAVTFAFTPYGADVDGLATAARAGGHEVLLQAPMEPFDYPDNDPGPQTLLTNLAADQNIDRLHWLMSRFQGYVGIANLMGARFTAAEAALAPILKETAKRGLIFVDDGSSPRSLAGQISSANNVPFAKAELTIDAVPNAVSIDRALSKLEALAREHGSAVGFASALPTSIDRIAEWAKAAETRGVLLVPITAAALKPKSS